MHNFVYQLCIILEQCAQYAPLLLGSYLAFSIMRLPQLSIESGFVLGAITGTAFLPNSTGIALAYGIGISGITGICVGIVAAGIQYYARISPLLSSIIVIGLTHSTSLLLLQGSHRALLNRFNPLHSINFLVQFPSLIMITIIALSISAFFYYFMKTRAGLACRVYGDNPKFLQHHRISTGYVLMLGLSAAHGLAGVSGYLVAQSHGFVDITMGTGIPLMCITALMLGAALTSSIKTSYVIVPLVGIGAYCAVQTVIVTSGFDASYSTALQAIIILVTLSCSKNSLIKGL